uniref:Uncharacterized protein n=2 Tax=Picea TaxID=3328 RepID=A0A101M599_PICGL|nr:hypothetical protein ABT39_MTgene1211 [Picea glauca]QHR92860.1 hypothetical protein Q903MT_gene6908 [Picea sitchensis]
MLYGAFRNSGYMHLSQRVQGSRNLKRVKDTLPMTMMAYDGGMEWQNRG